MALDDTKRPTNSHVQYLVSPLEKDGLITKQQYAYRYNNKPRHHILLHLARFHSDFRTRHKLLSEKIIEILRNTPGYIMSMLEMRKQLANFIGVQRLNEDLFKKIYQNLKNSEIIEYVTNDLRVSRKIITTSERDMRLTLKYIRENIDEEDMMPYVFPLKFNQPILEQGTLPIEPIGWL